MPQRQIFALFDFLVRFTLGIGGDIDEMKKLSKNPNACAQKTKMWENCFRMTSHHLKLLIFYNVID
jgi:hypothetical protein